MELVEGETYRGSILAFAIFGDGSFDKRIFEAILHKFNGKYSIIVPTLSFRATGGHGAIKILAWLIDNKQKFSVFPPEIWIIIDKEHKKELLDSLKIYFQHENLQAEDNILHISISRTGTEYISLIVIFMGIEKRIEENIAILIRERMNISIKPDKKEIGKILRKHGIKLKQLVDTSKKLELRKAFGRLIDLLEKYEET